MTVQTYQLIPGVVTIAIASQRTEPKPSYLLVFDKLHKEIAGRVRALLMEHKQTPPSFNEWPAATRLATYFPTYEGAPIYRVCELIPAGTVRDVDAEFQIEVTRIRFSFVLQLLPGAFLCGDTIGQAIDDHMAKAIKQVLLAGDVPNVSQPGDETIRPEEGTDVDCAVELGVATGRNRSEVPAGGVA